MQMLKYGTTTTSRWTKFWRP